MRLFAQAAIQSRVGARPNSMLGGAGDTAEAERAPGLPSLSSWSREGERPVPHMRAAVRKHWTMGGHSWQAADQPGGGAGELPEKMGLSQGRPGKGEKAVQAEVQTEQRPWGREEL